VAVRFGTDGIRGRASDEVTVDLAYRLGRAVATVFTVPVYVGYDTRESSPTLAAVLAGLRDGGATGVNSATSRRRCRGHRPACRGVGVVVSASHNPYYDNGLKVLGVGGTKLDHATEAAVESALNVAKARRRPTSTRSPLTRRQSTSTSNTCARSRRRISPRSFSWWTARTGRRRMSP